MRSNVEELEFVCEVKLAEAECNPNPKGFVTRTWQERAYNTTTTVMERDLAER